MLNLFRSFTLISLAVILGTATLACMGYRSLVTSWVLQSVEAQTVAVGRSAVRSLNGELVAYADVAAALEGDAIQSHPGMGTMQRAVTRHLQDFPLAGWAVYDPQGRTILATDLARVGQDASANVPAIRDTASGKEKTTLAQFERQGGLQGSATEAGDVVMSLVPIRHPHEARTVGVLGVRADVTQQLRSVKQGELVVVLGVFAICGVLCAVMFFVTRRAASVARVHIAQEIAATERLWINEVMRDRQAQEAAQDAESKVMIDTAVAVPKLVDDRMAGPNQQALLAALPSRAITLDRAQASQLEAMEERRGIEADLRAALERNELLLHFQPIVCLQKQRIVGAEVLVRWEHPVRGLLMPGEFVTLAEDSGLIVPLGEWILERACQVAGSWSRMATDPIFISVNLSARQFTNPRGLSAAIHRGLARGSLAPNLLELEVTEGLLTCDHIGTLELLREFRALGVRLSAQDFGRSFCNLSHLKRYPLTALKIDGSFARNYTSSADDAAIVTALMAIARGLGLTVTAQGLESIEQVAPLIEIGCAYGQGYAFGRPMTADDFFRAFAAAEDAAHDGEHPQIVSA